MLTLSYVFYVMVASVTACLAERVSPGAVPGGIVIAALIGSLGAWVGSLFMVKFGPELYGIALLPGSLCAVLSVIIVSYLSREFKRKKTN
ncbi:MAG: GlsB/YeaQ/YmgE family stress response membrane protein [Candidatus Melainabacteria bacterium]|nr:GlsB/YeaQ/YmgE family stress response membrane protein [Candidatus Melainabacteria bacterium]